MSWSHQHCTGYQQHAYFAVCLFQCREKPCSWASIYLEFCNRSATVYILSPQSKRAAI